jgi:hypothetical protein
MNCYNPVLPVSQNCGRYVFDPAFIDWSETTDSCGATVYIVGFGNAAVGPFPAMTECPTVIFHPLFTAMATVRDSCGVATTLVGYSGVPATSNMAALVALILADPVAKCAMVNGLVLEHPSNTLKAATNAAGDCGLAEGDAVTNWTL